MNEELKILIKAVTADAQKKLNQIRREIQDIDEKSKEAKKSASEMLSGIGKGATVAIGAVVAFTTAIVALGKSTQEFTKAQAKVNTAFQSMGSNSQQAANTFGSLFRFMGDNEAAAETAQSLALITTNEQELAEWTTILQGVYGAMGDKLPINSLAEAANETIRVGKVTGATADALNWLGISEDAFNEKLAQTTSYEEREALLRETLNGLYSDSASLYEQNNSSTLQYNESQYRLNTALAEATKYTVPLMTALNNLGSTMLTVFGGALQDICAYLVVFVQWIANAVSWVGSFFGLFGEAGEAVSSVEKTLQGVTNGASGFGSALGGATQQAKELKKQTMGFDELNVVSSQSSGGSSSGAGGGGVGGGSVPTIGGAGLGSIGNGFGEALEEAKEKMEGILVIVGLIGAGFAAWKIASVKDWAKVGGSLKTIGGYALAIAGAMLLIEEYSDAWANGVDWKNLGLMIAGAAAAVGGLYLAIGPLAASIATVGAGVAFLVLGVKDFINNGPSLQNIILIIGGAIAVAVGLATAGLSTLVSAIIGAVAAVGAFVAAIALEQPAIMSVEEAQNNLTDAKNRAVEAENSWINAVDAAEAAMNRLKSAEEAAGMSGADLLAQVEAGAITYDNMTAEQKELYKAYIDNEQKQKDLEASTKALEEAKKAETIASYENQLALAKESGNFEEYKKAVVDAFKNGEISADEARTLIEKSMSEMSDASQQTFMEDLPSDIKQGLDPNKYETTRKKIGDWFAGVGKFITEKIWQPIVNWWNEKVAPIFTKKWWSDKFSSIKEGIKGAMNGAIEAVEKAINSIVKKINTLSWDIPDWVPVIGGGKFGFNFKEVKIPRLATGGIVTSATTALIGEAGKEAVLPLENNTGWIDELADRLAQRNGTPSKIVLTLDGKELGWASINSINNITKQTGNLQLTLA